MEHKNRLTFKSLSLALIIFISGLAIGMMATDRTLPRIADASLPTFADLEALQVRVDLVTKQLHSGGWWYDAYATISVRDQYKVTHLLRGSNDKLTTIYLLKEDDAE